jgi:hypothetical protein
MAERRPRPKNPPSDGLEGALIEALQAFSRLADRTNAGGLSEQQTEAAITRIRKIRRDVQRTPKE